jgi:chemotaxis signal transduction protein
MTTVVSFRSGEENYAVPVERVREVRFAERLIPLPSPRPGILGLLADGDDAVTVMTMFGEGQAHLLLLDGDHSTFGLAVAEVTGVITVEDAVKPAPAGQEDELVVGMISTAGGMLMLVDVDAIGRRLDPA